DDERARITERLRLDVVLDEIPEARAAVDVGPAPLGLRAAKYSEAHGAPGSFSSSMGRNRFWMIRRLPSSNHALLDFGLDATARLPRPTLVSGGRRCDLATRCQRNLPDTGEIDLRHVEGQGPEHVVGELVVSSERATEPATPRGNPAVGVQLERRLA